MEEVKKKPIQELVSHAEGPVCGVGEKGAGKNGCPESCSCTHILQKGNKMFGNNM
jgi:hypothetical protein